MRVTKVEAIIKVMQENGGSATLQQIYQGAGRFYKGLKASANWQAGLRGTLYREIYKGRTFTKLDDATYGLKLPRK